MLESLLLLLLAQGILLVPAAVGAKGFLLVAGVFIVVGVGVTFTPKVVTASSAATKGANIAPGGAKIAPELAQLQRTGFGCSRHAKFGAPASCHVQCGRHAGVGADAAHLGRRD
jgi:hypothetical protein